MLLKIIEIFVYLVFQPPGFLPKPADFLVEGVHAAGGLGSFGHI
jgi:hypothetical protein